MEKVSAIIVTFNRLSILKKCVKYLLMQNHPLDKIIIVNNNSTDGTSRYLHKISRKNIFLIKNMRKNVGGAGGFCEGIRQAYENTNTDLFWLMDDDSLPTTDALSNLLYGVKELHNKFGFICSNVRSKNGYPCNVPQVDVNWDKYLPGNLIRIKRATFVSFMTSRKVVSKLGLPVSQMFIWGDDFEYSLRLHDNYPCYFVSNSIVIHNGTVSPNSSIFNLPRNKEKYLKYDFRNELYAIRKHRGFKDLIIKILRDIYFIIRIPFLAKNDKLRKIYCTLSGLIDGFFFNPTIKFPKFVNKRKY